MYVGQTHTPSIRFNGHLYSNKTTVGFWIKEILASGKEPVFKKLKIFPFPKRKNGKTIYCNMRHLLIPYEKEMILKYSKRGQAIFNKSGNPYYSSSKVTDYLNALNT